MNEVVPREVCTRCFRPRAVCYCHLVVELTTKTRVLILQHPRERHVPVNTARIASLCLPEAELHVGVDWSRSEPVRRALSDPERPAALLYPGPGAIDVATNPPRGPVTLVVVDGTWWQARKLVRANPALAALPRYAFRPAAPSEYRIRAEPHEDCLSTLEAMAHVLGILEGDGARFAAMLAPFREMVARQVEFAAVGGGRPRMRRPRVRETNPPRSPLHRVLRERFADVVVVVGEANAWPYDSPERAAGADELVLCVACRPATGEVFERFVAPRGALAPSTARHLEIDERSFAGASSREAFARDFAAFVRPTDVVASWGVHSLDLLARAGASLPRKRVDLRHAARLHARGNVGTLEAFVQALGAAEARAAEPTHALTSSRAARRLMTLVLIARTFADSLG